MFAVVFEPNRQKILQLVWTKERTAGEIAGEFETTFGAVSQHLKVLRDHGFLDVRKEGRERYYKANKKALGPMAKMFEQLWSGRLQELKTIAEQAERKKRRN